MYVNSLIVDLQGLWQKHIPRTHIFILKLLCPTCKWLVTRINNLYHVVPCNSEKTQFSSSSLIDIKTDILSDSLAEGCLFLV